MKKLDNLQITYYIIAHKNSHSGFLLMRNFKWANNPFQFSISQMSEKFIIKKNDFN